jgi:uncharacterized Zn-finger protein
MKDRGFCCKFPGCQRVYASKYNRRRHMVYEHPDFNQFECEVCHKVLSSRQNYRQHQHIHTGARPFMCEICGTGFRQGSQLTIHKRKHFLEVRCLPIFKLTDLLNSNSDQTHREELPTSTEEWVLPELNEKENTDPLPCFLPIVLLKCYYPPASC